MPIHRYFLIFSLVTLGGLTLCLPAFLNGSPFTYFDSAFYIFNAFNLSDPSFVGWRPLTYSFYIWPSLQVGGLWTLIVFQNLFIAAFITFVSVSLFQVASAKSFFFLLFVLLISPLSHISNFVMPDFATGLGALALSAAFQLQGRLRVTHSLLFLAFFLMHYSHTFIFLPLLSVMMFRRQKFMLSGSFALVMVLLLLLFFSAPKTGLQRSLHLFTYSKLISLKLVGPSSACLVAENPFCTIESRPFHIWDSSANSKINQEGGLKKALPKIAEANWSILTSSKIIPFLRLSLIDSVRQFLYFATPMEVVVHDEPLKQTIARYVPQSLDMFFQRGSTYDRDLFRAQQALFYYFLITLSFFGLLFCIWRRDLGSNLHTTFWVTFAAYAMNALTIGFASEAATRYGSRLAWVFPYLFAVHLLTRRQKRKNVNSDSLNGQAKHKSTI